MEPTLPAKDPFDVDTCRQLLNRVAASPQLKRATRLQELLLYLGQCSLKEGRTSLREQEIGAKVFGRPEGYDTSFDNIVRTNVSDLRKRIEAYFRGEGQHEPVIMEIPRGSYVPMFRARPSEPPKAQELPLTDELHAPNAAVNSTKSVETRIQSRWMITGIAAGVVLVLALSASCVMLWLRLQSIQHSLYAWRSLPAVSSFWSGFIDDPRGTDLILSDSSYALVQDLGKRSFSLKDYVSRDYLNHLQDTDPRMTAALNRISEWNIGSTGQFDLAQELLAMDPAHHKIHTYFVRKYAPDLIKGDNVILLGSRYANPWTELMENQMNFVFSPDNPFEIVNRTPSTGEQRAYDFTPGSVGYCVVAYLQNPGNPGKVLLIEGSSSEAEQAGGDFLLSEDRMESFEKKLGVSRLPYFELLLKISWVKGTPLNSTIEAYRTYGTAN